MKAFIAPLSIACFGSMIDLSSGHGYIKTPRARNYRAYQDGIWWGGGNNTPLKESCPQCLSVGGTKAACGMDPASDDGRNYDYPTDTKGGALPWLTEATYSAGSVIDIEVVITAHHQGHFEFKACPVENLQGVASQACFDEHPLEFVMDVLSDVPKDANYPVRAYLAPLSETQEKDGDLGGVVYKYKFKLPDDISGPVLLQWHYISSNSCSAPGYSDYSFPPGWQGTRTSQCRDMSTDGMAAPEQFWNCAEVYVSNETSPSPEPDVFPTNNPTRAPTSFPTKNPTKAPTQSPTNSPTKIPTASPVTPTATPTAYPVTTASPTASPTANPTPDPPTNNPTKDPTQFPTINPSIAPTTYPTKNPTSTPSGSFVTYDPTAFPVTIVPTESPVKNPTTDPTISSTTNPTLSPSNNLTKAPTASPSNNPTKAPTASPSNNPTKAPTASPSNNLTNAPTVSPTNKPTDSPTATEETPTCPDGFVGFKAVDNCSGFVQCPSNLKTACPEGLLFDETISVCNWSYAVTCGSGRKRNLRAGMN